MSCTPRRARGLLTVLAGPARCKPPDKRGRHSSGYARPAALPLQPPSHREHQLEGAVRAPPQQLHRLRAILRRAHCARGTQACRRAGRAGAPRRRVADARLGAGGRAGGRAGGLPCGHGHAGARSPLYPHLVSRLATIVRLSRSSSTRSTARGARPATATGGEHVAPRPSTPPAPRPLSAPRSRLPAPGANLSPRSPWIWLGSRRVALAGVRSASARPACPCPSRDMAAL